MAIQISPELQARIAVIAEHGDYDSIDAILDETLTLFEERERLQHLKDLLAQGVRDVAEGKVRTFTPERREQLWQQALSEPKPPPVPHDGA